MDTELLKRAINHFEASSSPTNSNINATCTVGDLRRVIDNTANLIRIFVRELEK